MKVKKEEGHMHKVQILARAMVNRRMVRFSYHTKGEGKVIPRVGWVKEITPTHVLISDVFRNAPRSVILDRIIGEVEEA